MKHANLPDEAWFALDACRLRAEARPPERAESRARGATNFDARERRIVVRRFVIVDSRSEPSDDEHVTVRQESELRVLSRGLHWTGFGPA